MRQPNNFNFVAPFYRWLSLMVYGRKLEAVQHTHLNLIEPGANILVLGGGSGEILNHLPADSHITFLDLSEAMLDQAKKKRRVHFVHADFLQWESTEHFDCIITPFFLDCFAPDDLQTAIQKIKVLLQPDGRLIVVDFYHDGRRTTGFLLRLMHLFFRWTANLSSGKLQDIHETVLQEGFFCIEKQEERGSTFSAVYIRSGDFPLMLNKNIPAAGTQPG